MHPRATLSDLAREIPDAVVAAGAGETVVRDVRHDSREVEPGDLFVARRGQKNDGARFVGDAIARGAVAIVADREIESSVPVLRVLDVELALALASSAVWGHPSFALDVVGITGTNGKTTTAWLLEHALGKLGHPTGLLGTVEHRFGSLRWPALHTTPEADDVARRSAAMRDAGATHLVMEVSSHAIALKRVHAVRFRVGVLTNVTQDHLDFHGSFGKYAATKQAFFLEMGPAASVLNLDDPVGRATAERMSSCIGYSASGALDARVRVVEATFATGGIAARVETDDGEVRLESPLVGKHNLENLLASLGALISLEINASVAAEALRDARGAPGRLERVRLDGAADGQPAVFVDYAHTPDALTNVLSALRATRPRRLICVFGCGGDRDPTKRAPMGEAVAKGADVAIVTTDNPRSEEPSRIAEQAAEGLRKAGVAALSTAGDLASAMRGYWLEIDRRRAIGLAIGYAGENDVVLVAGKGHEPYQEVNGVRTPFDDRDEARHALEARRGA